MDNRNGQSSGTGPKHRKFQRRLINISAHTFEEIRKVRGFVDHTHFIRNFLLKKRNLAIFAPRCFGISSHLNMVREFLQIDVDKTTGEVSSSVNGPAKGRKNYRLFEGTRIITDDNNKDLVEDHLGKHPVIHFNFSHARIRSVEDAEMHCRRAMHRAFEDHSYLEDSTKLVPGDEERNATAQLFCRRWCDYEQYKMQDLNDSLVNLTKYLYNHFNRAEVYILVDGFDVIYAEALRNIPKENPDDNRVAKLQNICDILGSLLGPVTEGCDHVGGVLFTGVSSVIGLGGYSSHFNNLTTMKFLDDPAIFATDQDFVPFYGATREEVESLIKKFVENKQLVMFEGKEKFLNDINELDVKKIMDDVQSRYNGYFDRKGNHIFSLCSVLEYLESGYPRSYWTRTERIRALCNTLKCEKVAYEIIKLVRGEMIEFQRHDKIMVQDLVKLHDILAVKNEDKVDSDVVFNFMMDLGYLTYPEGGGKAQDGKCKLPNVEVREVLSDMIKSIVRWPWNIPIDSCTDLIDDIWLFHMNNKKALQNMMLRVYEEISLMLRPLEQTNRALVIESKMLCIMYTALIAARSFELCIDLQIKDAEGNLITLDRSNFLMHKRNEKCSILWEVKYNNDSKDKYTTSLYALQEARGIVTTKHGKIKNLMDPVLKSLGREVLVIGLSIDSDIKVSLSYALGMDQQIFFKSEGESTSFPNLYQIYNTVPLPLEENEY